MNDTMKKFIFVIFAISLLAVFPAKTAYSDEEIKYSRILSDDVVLYMDANLTKPWFTLPYSYYVKVLSVGSYSVKVEYKGGDAIHPSVKGYIELDKFSLAKEEPTAPYPNSSFTIGENCLLYKDTGYTYAETITENSIIDFYGINVRPSGETYVYGYVSTASGDNYMGYILQSAILNFALPILPVEVVKPEESVSENKPASESPKTSNALGDNLQIIIIVGISVVAISIVYLLFKPMPEKAKEEVITKSEWNEDE